MAATECVYHLRNFRDCTLVLHVAQTKELKLRLWLGLKLIRLACRIIGLGVEVDINTPADSGA